jgi:hypothetical protein
MHDDKPEATLGTVLLAAGITVGAQAGVAVAAEIYCAVN